MFCGDSPDFGGDSVNFLLETTGFDGIFSVFGRVLIALPIFAEIESSNFFFVSSLDFPIFARINVFWISWKFCPVSSEMLFNS